MVIIEEAKPAEEIKSRKAEYMAGVFLWIRPLYANILKGFRDQCTKIAEQAKYNPKTGKFESVTEFDSEKYEDLITDYLLDKWEGLGGKDRQPLPVNLNSKKAILNYLPTRDFVWAFAQSLDTTEAETKNS